MSEAEWVTVFQSMDEYAVHLRMLHLKANEIDAQVFNQKDSSYGTFGYVYLNVRGAQEQQAIELLKAYDE